MSQVLVFLRTRGQSDHVLGLEVGMKAPSIHHVLWTVLSGENED